MPVNPGAVLHIEHVTSRNPLARQPHSYRRRVNGRKLGGPGEFHTDEDHALAMALRTTGVTVDRDGQPRHPYYLVVLDGWTPTVQHRELGKLDRYTEMHTRPDGAHPGTSIDGGE